MSSLRMVGSNRVEFAPFGAWRFRVLMGLLAALGVGGLWVAFRQSGGESTLMMGLAGAVMFGLGVWYGGQVTRFVIDRESGEFTRKWGFLRLRQQETETITLLAVRITLNKDSEGGGSQNLYLVKRPGEIKIGYSVQCYGGMK